MGTRNDLLEFPVRSGCGAINRDVVLDIEQSEYRRFLKIRLISDDAPVFRVRSGCLAV